MRYPGSVAPKATYVDRPDLMEALADTLENMTCDGETLRMEFCIDRLAPDLSAATAPPKVNRHPVARVVMPLSAAVDMANKLNRLLASIPSVQGSIAPWPIDNSNKN